MHLPCHATHLARHVFLCLALLQWFSTVEAASDRIDARVTSTPLTGRATASDVVAFSFEVPGALQLVSFQGRPRPSMVNLMQLMRAAAAGGDDTTGVAGPSLRIGGDSTDDAAWVPAGQPLPCNYTYRLSAVDVQALAAALPLWNGTFTPGVNFRDPVSAEWAVAHVKHLVQTFAWTPAGPLAAVEIGNEPDLYHKNGVRNANFTFDDYDAQWSAYAAALQPLLPPQRLQGGTFCCFYEQNISGYLARHRAALASFSQHQYPLRNCGLPKPNGNTIEDLLNNSASAGRAQHVQPFVRAAAALGVPYVIGEGNSVACGGQWNVSDTMAAALWAIDTVLEHAAVDVQRWHFHMGPTGAYSAILVCGTRVFFFF